MLFCGGQVTGEQFSLATQGGAEGLPARGAQPLRFGGNGVGEGNHLRVRPRAIQKTLSDAEVPVEHPQGQVRHMAGLVQVGPDAAVQFAPRMRGGGLRPRCDHQRRRVPGLQRQPACHG